MTTHFERLGPNVVPVALRFREDDPGFLVLEARAALAMSEDYELELTVEHPDHALSPADFLSRACDVAFPTDTTGLTIGCIVKRMRQIGLATDGISRFVLVLVSPYWILTRFRDHRIRRDRTIGMLAADMISKVAGLSPPVFDLAEEHEAKPYRVQYGERDHAYLMRSLSEEGIASYHDFLAGGALVLTDDTSLHRRTDVRVLPYAAPGTLAQHAEHVYEVSLDATQPFRSARVRDYWFERPLFEAVAVSLGPEASGEGDLERYEFVPGAGSTEAALKRHARDALDAERAPASVLVVRTNVMLWPGQRLRIEHAPRAEAEQELLVVRTSSHFTTAIATQGGGATPVQEHRLVCVPAATRFRPERLPKPRIDGVQMGRVTGEGEIDVDEHGRVAVVFPWDPSSTTIRIRVSQGWAGLGYGLVTLPRVGDEVLVSYVDGDPDQPVIVGRLHNGVNASPLDLPKEKTVSVWRTKSSPGGAGYNEIKMDDLAGEERFDIHAQRDMTTRVERDADLFVGRDTNLEVIGDQRSWVSGSGNVGYRKNLDLVAEETTITGRAKLKLDGKYVNIVAGYRDDMVQGNLNVSAENEYHHAGSLFKVDGPMFQVHASTHIELVCGGSSILLEPGKITIKSSGEVVINGSPIKLNC